MTLASRAKPDNLIHVSLTEKEAQALYQTAKHGVWIAFLQPSLVSALRKLQAARQAAADAAPAMAFENPRYPR